MPLCPVVTAEFGSLAVAAGSAALLLDVVGVSSAASATDVCLVAAAAGGGSLGHGFHLVPGDARCCRRGDTGLIYDRCGGLWGLGGQGAPWGCVQLWLARCFCLLPLTWMQGFMANVQKGPFCDKRGMKHPEPIHIAIGTHLSLLANKGTSGRPT